MPSRRYEAPCGKVGRRYVNAVVRELRRVRDRQWNSERFIVFQTVTLQRACHVTASWDICRRIKKRLDAWEAGQYSMLVEDTLLSCTQYLTAVRREETAEHRAKTYRSLVFHGKLRKAVRWITEQDKWGVLLPEEKCMKTRERVMEVLRTKHPDARPLSAACLDAYPNNPPEMVPVDITNDVVAAVAGRLSGGADPGGTDLVSLQHWMLRFGVASGELRKIIAEFGEWLSNGRPQWAAYCAMMSGRLIALDISTGIRPVGIGKTWRRLLAKCLLRVTGQDEKAACGTDHIAGGVEAGTEVAIHATRLQWTQHYQEEEWGFLLIDARNVFNEKNQTAMLWAVRHEWPGCAQFTFNCYRHWAMLLVRYTADGSGHFLHSKGA